MSTYDNEILTVPIYLQTGSYDAKSDRKILSDVASPGIVGVNDFALTLAGTLNVQISGGAAYVLGQNVVEQGTFREYESAAKTLTCGTAHATLPRLDQVILRVMDNNNDSSGYTEARLEVIPGTATSGATLDNRNGAANLTTLTQASKSVLLLHDVLVPAAATVLVSGDVRDKRVRAQLGKGNLLAQDTTFAKGTTVGALSPVADGKPALLRVGSSPFDFVALVYDSTYGKWVSSPLFCPLGKISNTAMPSYGRISSNSIDNAPFIIPNFKDFWDAGLRPQIYAGARLTTALATLVRGHIWCFNDADGALTEVGATGTLLNFAATANLYRASDFADLVTPTTPTKQQGLVDLEFQVASNIGMIDIGLGFRWVSA